MYFGLSLPLILHNDLPSEVDTVSSFVVTVQTDCLKTILFISDSDTFYLFIVGVEGYFCT